MAAIQPLTLTRKPTMTSPRFRVFTRVLIDYEDGGTNGRAHKNPGDTGGWTQWGFSSKAYPQLAAKIQAGLLTRADAEKLAFQGYYAPILGIEDIHPAIGYILYDAKFHGSADIFIKRLQIALNNAADLGLLPDGSYGRKTAEATLIHGHVVAPTFVNELSRDARLIATEINDRIERQQIKQHMEVVDMTAAMYHRVRFRVEMAASAFSNKAIS
jgi:lysozyme family protein